MFEPARHQKTFKKEFYRNKPPPSSMLRAHRFVDSATTARQRLATCLPVLINEAAANSAVDGPFRHNGFIIIIIFHLHLLTDETQPL